MKEGQKNRYDRRHINMANTKGIIIKNEYMTIDLINSANETKLEFVDGWRQEILW